MTEDIRTQLGQIMMANKYRTPIKMERRNNKNVVVEAMYIIDVPKVLDIFLERYDITPKDNGETETV